MKKVLVFLTVILFSMPMRAQNLTLLDSIKNVNANVMTLEAKVHNHTKKTDRTIEKDGDFYYSFSDKFSAVPSRIRPHDLGRELARRNLL